MCVKSKLFEIGIPTYFTATVLPRQWKQSNLLPCPWLVLPVLPVDDLVVYFLLGGLFMIILVLTAVETSDGSESG